MRYLYRIFSPLLLLLLLGSQISTAQLTLNNQPSVLPKPQSVIGIQADNLLKPQQAFIPSATADENDPTKITVSWQIDPHYYLYKNKISIHSLSKNITIISQDLPEGKAYSDEFFGEQEIYDEAIEIQLTLSKEALTARDFFLEIEAQGCAKEGLCFAPYTWEFPVLLNPDLKSSDADRIVSTKNITKPIIAEHDRLSAFLFKYQILAIPLFFLLGVLLTFTPCVLPMLPILSGILKGDHNITKRRGFLIALVYVLAMSTVYTLLGLLAASMGKGLAAGLQHPYVLTAFSAVFVLLSLSMFGAYTLQMPTFIQTRLSKLSANQANGTLYSAAIMGALSALIVGPCITAPLIGIITFIAQSQSYLLGGIALFAMGLGMGIPLIILGVSSGHFLPKAGAWMNHISVLFGFMLLGLAAYFLGRTLSSFWENGLYALIAFATGIWLLYIIFKKQSLKKLFTIFALLFFATGTYFSIEAIRPKEALDFSPIKGIAGLNQALKASNNRITMLEFNATWCVACKEMEKYVFSNEAVKTKLAALNTLVADVTKNDDEDKALQQHFKIYGPPAMLFFDQKGNELPEYRIMGTVSAKDFLNHIDLISSNYH